MKLLHKAFIMSAALFCLLACKKTNWTVPKYDDYAALNPGNYWVYQEFSIDTNGNATATNVFDSAFVEKDTMINGGMYAKVVEPGLTSGFPPLISFQRDSLSYIIDNSGAVLFSSNKPGLMLESGYYIVAFHDTVALVDFEMTDINAQTTVPAGTFTTMNYQATYYMFPMFSAQGNVRYLNTRYAKNMGIISQPVGFYEGSILNFERRLARYHLN